MKRLAGLSVLIGCLAGCRATPTKIVETQEREFVQVVEKAHAPLALTGNTVILDARSSFDYGLNRVQNSLHLGWADLAENPRTGEVLRDGAVRFK